MIWSFTNGWNTNVSRVNPHVYLIGLLIICQQPVLAEEAEQPSMALLEFLGEAEMSGEVWVDALDMLALPSDETDAKPQEEQESD